MLTLLSSVLVLAMATVLLLASRKPDQLHVERSITIDAPPESIFALIDELRAWEAWTPYDRDPNVERTYGGPARGVGATYAWKGNKEVGEGRITLTESHPPSAIALDLDIVKPFEGHNKVRFAITPEQAGTRVSWALTDNTPFMGKVVAVFVNLNKLIGKDFELGLARLKQLAER